VRTVAWLVVCCTIVLSGGCAIWEAEISNRGGYLDHVADEHWLRADSKRMRALRAFALQVSLARIASVAAKNESDRQLLAIRIGATTKRFLPVLDCAFERNLATGAIRDPCFYYDSAMVDYSTALLDLAKVALPVEDAKKLMDVVTGSFVNPLNVVELLETLISLGRQAFRYGRVVGALYRDTIELEVQVWLATPRIDTRPFPYRVTVDHVAPLGAIYDTKSDNLQAWKAAIAALRSQGLEPLPELRFFDQLAGLLRYICDLITKEPDALRACKTTWPIPPQDRLAPPAPVLGPLLPPRAGALIERTTVVSRRSDPVPPSGPARTCPPTGQGRFDAADTNAKMLRDYLTSAPPAEVSIRESNLSNILSSPEVRDQLVPDRPLQLRIVLSVSECREVQRLMAVQAKEKGFIN